MNKKVIEYPYYKITRDTEGNELNRELITLKIIFNYNESNPNIHIEDSWQLDLDFRGMEACLEYIRATEEFKELEAIGYTRSAKSQEREWYGHNVLYSWGKSPEQTGSVDLDQNESLLRRLAYFLLYTFF